MTGLHRLAPTVTATNTINEIEPIIKKRIMSTGQKCFDRKLSNYIFHSYVENLCCTKETRNNNALSDLLLVKLEVRKQSFYFGGANIYNTLY